MELSLACADVPRLDVASKSDPFCVIFCKDGEAWRRTGMTETVYDTHACQWVQKIPAQATDGTVYRFDVGAPGARFARSGLPLCLLHAY